MSQNIDEYREYMRNYVRRRYKKLKLDAVAYKGGKCERCGYDKCNGAMTFHHTDPSIKDADWNRMRKWSWEKIKAELDKCEMLCANCHHEEHYDQLAIDEAVAWLETKSSGRLIGQIRNCPKCNQQFSGSTVYCSAECFAKSRTKINWPDDVDFIRMVDDIGRVKASKQLGVSDRAVGKHYRRIKESL